MIDCRAHQSPRWFDLERLCQSKLVREIDFYQTIGSTNDQALAMGSDLQHACPWLILSEEQTGGRGRGNNRWWAKPGALTFSLIIEPAQFQIPPGRWPLISLATAIAVSDVLGHFGGGNKVGLKWPNDLHLNHKKVSGILVETLKQNCPRMVIGIGLNVRNSFGDAPAELRQIATSLVDETGFEWELTQVLESLLTSMQHRLHELGAGALQLQEVWARHCVLTGKRVSLEAADRRVSGICRGINEHGALILESDGQTQAWFGGVVRIE